MSIYVYELGGTSPLSLFGYNFDTWPWTPTDAFTPISDNFGLNGNFTAGLVWYPAAPFPMGPSVQDGINLLTTQVNMYSPHAGDQFVLIGTSQGAMACSQFYTTWRNGPRANDLIGAVMFGNPAREAGHTFPGCPDPGGHGIWEIRLTDTEEKWWEFALPNDPATTQGDELPGLFATFVFSLIQANNLDAIRQSLVAIVNLFFVNPGLIFAPGFDAFLILAEIIDTFITLFTVHTQYDFVPILFNKTSKAIAVEYINSLAPADASTAVTPTVPAQEAIGWSHAGAI